jgi:hypothetical protein
VSLQSRDIQQLLGKLSKFVCNCCKMATPQQKAFCIQNVTILQHGLPWRRRPETLSRVSYKQTLRVFLTIDCKLTGYFIMNMWKCYLLFLLFELPCILKVTCCHGYLFLLLLLQADGISPLWLQSNLHLLLGLPIFLHPFGLNCRMFFGSLSSCLSCM